MATRFFKTSFLVLTLLSTTALFSFTKGGDALEVYFNGKQLLQQFLHADKSVKTLQLFSVGDNDKMDLYYTHCGYPGKSRVLSIRDEKNNLLKQFKFNDVKTARSPMTFTFKDLRKPGTLRIYYSSKETPDAKLLAIVSINNDQTARN